MRTVLFPSKPAEKRRRGPDPQAKVQMEVEADFLPRTGEVRQKYLRLSPADIAWEDDSPTLEHLWERYFPASQPRTLHEEVNINQ